MVLDRLQQPCGPSWRRVRATPSETLLGNVCVEGYRSASNDTNQRKVHLLWKKAVTKEPCSGGYGCGWKFDGSDWNIANCAAGSIPCRMCHGPPFLMMTNQLKPYGLTLEHGEKISLVKVSIKISWVQRTLNDCLPQWIEIRPRRGRLGEPTEMPSLGSIFATVLCASTACGQYACWKSQQHRK